LKQNLTEKEIMIQIDFSENYTTKYAKEIQSTHFAKNQLSIHTGVYYSRTIDNSLQSRSFATVSDNLDHQAHAVWVHMRPILTTILENKDVDTLHIYSDGPTSKYRNHTNINFWLQTLINEFKQITKATWIFSEPGHGKGPMDGVGGHLKKTADSHVLMGKDIKTALDFANLFTESVIQVKVIPDDDITRAKNIVPKTLDAIPGIMNITKITWERGPEVLIRLYGYEHFHKELKLTTFSNNLNVKSIELMDVSIESPNPEKPMDTNDFEDLTFEKKQKSNSVQAGTSSSYGKESLHQNLISTGTFLLSVRAPNFCSRGQ
jgi:hypothetical protein